MPHPIRADATLGAADGAPPVRRSSPHMVGMENSAPSFTPDGQRAVTFFDFV